jgi:hypothetical protein
MVDQGCNFKPILCNLKNEASREAAYFTRYIEEVYRDHVQTQLLAVNYMNITAKSDINEVKLGVDKAPPTPYNGYFCLGFWRRNVPGFCATRGWCF